MLDIKHMVWAGAAKFVEFSSKLVVYTNDKRAIKDQVLVYVVMLLVIIIYFYTCVLLLSVTVCTWMAV